MADAPVYEVIDKVPAKQEVVKDAPAVDSATTEPATKEPVAVKSYTQAEVDEITKKVKENARRKRDEARQETQALRRILDANSRSQQPHGAQPQPAAGQPQPTRQVDAPQPPKREQYADDNAYFEAVVDYRADLKVTEHLNRRAQQSAEQHARQSAEQLERTYSDNTEKARAKYDDYDDVVNNPSLPSLHPMTIQAIKSLENGPDIAFAIGSDPAEAVRIARLHPILQLKELGKIEAKLATPAAPAGTPAVTPAAAAAAPSPAAKKSALPAPLKPVTPKDAKPDSGEPSDDDDDATWLKKRQKQLRENGKR